MSSLRAEIQSYVEDACEQIGLERRFGEIVDSDRPDLGQFQCNGALAGAKILRQNPRQIAGQLIDRLRASCPFCEWSVAGPGFVNISVSPDHIARHTASLKDDPRLGCDTRSRPVSRIIDFGGPNVAKPMHVGHLRSTIIGDALQRLFRFAGDTVTSDVHLGDWGTQMGMLIDEMRRRQPDLPYFDESGTGPWPAQPPVTIDDLEAMYPHASAQCKDDPGRMKAAQQATVELQRGRAGYRALWRHFVDVSIAALKEDFALLGVTFDVWKGESDTRDRVPAMIERLKAGGHAVESEGALIIPVDGANDKTELPPLLLVKQDGGVLYGTTDLAAIDERVSDMKAQAIAYVVDKRQALHFTQVFEAARKTAIAADTELVHVAFGTVNGPDGKPFKTREGGVMKLRDLIEAVESRARERMKEAGIAQEYDADEQQSIARAVGIAALKFADLSNYRMSDYVFDLDKFTRFEGKTGPYILYSAVRIKSILRKAAQQGLEDGPIVRPGQYEQALMEVLCGLPDYFERAQKDYAPHHLCEFVYRLAQEFNRFYRECHITREENKTVAASRLSLAIICLAAFECVLKMLGISIPDRM